MRRRTILWLSLLSLLAAAPEFEFRASINADKIGLDDLLVYTVTFRGAEKPQPPDVSAIQDFRIVQSSRSSEFRFVNGISSHYTHFEYFLRPLKTGTLSIPPATCIYEKQTHQSEAFQIEVVEGSVGPLDRRSQRRPSVFDDDLTFQPFTRRNQAQEIDVKLQAEVSKENVVVGEQIVYNILLVTRNRIESVNPVSGQTFPGFWSEWYPVPRSIDGEVRQIDGKQYHVYEIRKAALYPRRAGKLTIPAFQFELGLVDDTLSFFSTPRSLRREPPEIHVTVDPLPAAAEGLPVGEFRLDMEPVRGNHDVNDILTLVLRIRGRGNIKTLPVPEIESHEAYEVFPAKITREYDFSAPLLSGTVELPPVSFSYFNPDSRRVVTLSSDPVAIDLTGTKKESQQPALSVPKTEIIQTGDDIDFIKKGEIYDQNRFFHRSTFFGLLFLAPFLFNVLLLLKIRVWNPLMKQNRFLNHKKVLNQTVKRLRQVRDYGEIQRLLEEYLQKKTGLGLSEISHRSIEELLRKSAVSDYDIDAFIRIKSQSESSRFSPHRPTREALNHDVNTLTAILRRIDSRLS